MVRFAIAPCVVAIVVPSIQLATVREVHGKDVATKSPVGTWIVLVNETKTSRLETPAGYDYQLKITKDEFIWNTNGLMEKSSYKIIDGNLGSLDIRNGTVLNKCLFRVDGDMLTICIGWFGAPRPKSFKIDQEPRASLVTLKRKR